MKPEIDSYEGSDQTNVQIFRDDVGTRVPDIVSYLMGAIHSSSGNAQRKMGGYANATVDALLEEAEGRRRSVEDQLGLAAQRSSVTTGSTFPTATTPCPSGPCRGSSI